MVLSATPSLITLSSNLLHRICLQHIYPVRISSGLTSKINRCHLIIGFFCTPKSKTAKKEFLQRNVLCLEINGQELAIFWCSYVILTVQVTQFQMLNIYMLSEVGRAFSCLQGLNVFSKQEAVICNRSWRGTPVETNGLASDK